MFYILAHNIKDGGGATQLIELLEGLNELKEVKTTIYINKIKFNIKINENITIIKCKKSIFYQIYLEFLLFRIVNKTDTLLFFSSKPPFFKLNCKTFTFIQNKYVLSKIGSFKISIELFIKSFLLRILFRVFQRNSNYLIVQNYDMQKILLAIGIENERIQVKPFNNYRIDKLNKKKVFDKKKFIYPASYIEHKNHINLVEAWFMLSKKELFPELHLTISLIDYNKILFQLKKNSSNKINIFIHGNLERNELFDLYEDANALIFPSLFESYGIPLIEASYSKLDIIASELDYVRDLPITLTESFNPNSPISIARAVERYHGIQNNDLKIISSVEFIKSLLK